MISADGLQFFITQASAWAGKMHAELYPKGDSLSDPTIRALTPFFGAETLGRIRRVFLEEIPNPPFYSLLAERGIPVRIDFTEMAAITFLDTVVISKNGAELAEPAFTSLLFLEAVHVVQYEHLGLDRFMHDYVAGWAANSFDYFAIPLERHAYELQVRFDDHPSRPFSVHDEVRRFSAQPI